ncbi:MAG: hypothetical protein KC731_41710, partial [Myxococcales bacterium]|nr:hypothetical protein [Myxococcales bacterium]
AADEDCDGEINDHCAIWSVSLGDSGEDRSNGVAAFDDGVVVSGDYARALQFGDDELTVDSGAQRNAYLARFDEGGKPDWIVDARSGGSVQLRRVSSAGSRLYAAGLLSGSLDVAGRTASSTGGLDGIVLAVDAASGSVDWLASVGGGGDLRLEAVAGHAAGVVAVGYFDGDLDLGSLGNVAGDGVDTLVLALDEDGLPRWARVGTGAGDDMLLRSVVVGDEVVVAGFFEDELDFGCDDPVSAVDVASDGFVARFAIEDGSCRPLLTLPGAGSVRARGLAAVVGRIFVAIDFDGDVTLPGGETLTSAGERDVAVIALTPEGEVIWSRQFGDEQNQDVFAVAATADGGVFLGGSASGNPDFGEGPINSNPKGDNAFVVRLSPSGEVIWARSFGGDGDDDTIAVSVAPSGSLYIAGEVETSMDLGRGVITGNAIDGFVARLSP